MDFDVSTGWHSPLSYTQVAICTLKPLKRLSEALALWVRQIKLVSSTVTVFWYKMNSLFYHISTTKYILFVILWVFHVGEVFFTRKESYWGNPGLKLRSQETMEVKYLASRQTLSAGGQELLESREDVNDEKRASGGEEKRTVVENNWGERIAERRRRRQDRANVSPRH